MYASVNSKFWKGKKVFITGHTGFKGSWLSLWLQKMEVDIKGFALAPSAKPSLFEEGDVGRGMNSEIGNICDRHAILASIIDFNPDILIHMAAQSLVQSSFRDPVTTYATNVMGTVHVLEAVRHCSNLKAAINVTSDKCYKNKEWEWGYREKDPMGGDDPYSSSKGCAELITSAYRNSFFSNSNSTAIASVRSGNVIGGGDWGEGRLIPDILRSFEHDRPITLRNPEATRPWQHVLEPLSGYLVLAERLYCDGQDFAQGWNFGPFEGEAISVKQVVECMGNIWNKKIICKRDNSQCPREANNLALSISKAIKKLNWQPVWNLQTTLESITSWHQKWLDRCNTKEQCLFQINAYHDAMLKR